MIRLPSQTITRLNTHMPTLKQSPMKKPFHENTVGEKLLPDDDFSGYGEKGNASTRRGFFFSSETRNQSPNLKDGSTVNTLMYCESASSEISSKEGKKTPGSRSFSTHNVMLWICRQKFARNTL